MSNVGYQCERVGNKFAILRDDDKYLVDENEGIWNTDISSAKLFSSRGEAVLSAIMSSYEKNPRKND